MLAHSAKFHAAMLSGAPFKLRSWVTRQRHTVFGPDDVLLTSPMITFDEFASSRRQLQASIPDLEGRLRPRFITNTFAPYGNELIVQYGLDVGGGVYEYLQMGVFRLLVNNTDTSGVMTVTGFDRSYVISSQSNETPHVITVGTDLASAIGDWATEKFPDVEFVFDGAASGELIASTLVYDDSATGADPFQNMRDLALLFGRELFFDSWGRLILRPIPTQTGGPFAAVYTPGEMNVAIGGSVIMDGRGVKNVARVIAEGSALPSSLIGTAEVTDPGDPLFAGVGSLVGRLVETVRTSALDTQQKVDDAAAALLVQKKGVTQNTTITLAPIAAHEPGDIVAYASERESIKGIYALSRWTLPLDMVGSMSLATRVLQTVS